MGDSRGSLAWPASLAILAVGIVAIAGIVVGAEALGANDWVRAKLHWNFVQHTALIAVPLMTALVIRSRRRLYALVPPDATREVVVGGCFLVAVAAPPLLVSLAGGGVRLAQPLTEFPAATLVFQLLMVPAGEELFCRGMLQGECNAIFGRPWRLGRTRFGPAVLIIAGLFGAAHLVNVFTAARVELHFLNAGFAAAVGLLLCLAREHFNGLIAVSLMHVAFNAHVFFAYDEPGGTAVWWTTGIVSACMFAWMAAGRPSPPDAA